jgi:HEPN domain-containing protein
MVTEYVKNWFRRADDDLILIEVTLKRKDISPNTICFHAQQAAEKYLKGFLAYHDLHVRKIHDLETLIQDCGKIDKSLETLRDSAVFLDQFYIESRYPDDYIEFSWEEAEEAYEAAKEIKEFVLKKVGLGNNKE